MDAKDLYERGRKAASGHDENMGSRERLLAIRSGYFIDKDGVRSVDPDKLLAAVLSGEAFTVRGAGKTTVMKWCKWLESIGKLKDKPAPEPAWCNCGMGDGTMPELHSPWCAVQKPAPAHGQG